MKNYIEHFKRKRINAFINEKKVILRSFNNQVNRRKTIYQKKIKFIYNERNKLNDYSMRNSFTLK